MKTKYISFLVIAISFSGMSCYAQSHFKKRIQLQATCFWEQKNRKVTDTFNNQIAIVTKENNGKHLLLINNKKYLTCNLPESIKDTAILITAYVLQTLQTEKVVATPLKLVSAYSY